MTSDAQIPTAQGRQTEIIKPKNIVKRVLKLMIISHIYRARA